LRIHNADSTAASFPRPPERMGILRDEEQHMGKMRENPRYNIISMRISETEHEYLKKIMQKTNRSVSDIMREAMKTLAARHGLEGRSRTTK